MTPHTTWDSTTNLEVRSSMPAMLNRTTEENSLEAANGRRGHIGKETWDTTTLPLHRQAYTWFEIDQSSVSPRFEARTHTAPVDTFFTTLEYRSIQQPPRSNFQSQRLYNYFQAIVQSGILSQDMADISLEVWKKLRYAVRGCLEVPSAMPGPDNQLMYTWRHGDHYFELEIVPGGTAEFFYKNRLTGELWEFDYTVVDSVPQAVQDKLSLFTDA